MSKTVTVPTRPGWNLVVDLEELASAAAAGPGHLARTRWEIAGLVEIRGTSATLTPRGEDLLASAHLIPDDSDSEPEEPVCKACGNTGKVPIIGPFTNPCTEPGRTENAVTEPQAVAEFKTSLGSLANQMVGGCRTLRQHGVHE